MKKTPAAALTIIILLGIICLAPSDAQSETRREFDARKKGCEKNCIHQQQQCVTFANSQRDRKRKEAALIACKRESATCRQGCAAMKRAESREDQKRK